MTTGMLAGFTVLVNRTAACERFSVMHFTISPTQKYFFRHGYFKYGDTTGFIRNVLF